MVDKLFNRAIVQRRDRSTFAPKPMNQVFGHSNVPPGRNLCIAPLAQFLRKPFKHAAIWPSRSSWIRKADSKNSANMTSSFLGQS
jgi:hypothetical protein